MNESKILKDFEEFGKKASYHFADDSGKEWGLGNDAERKAIQLYVDNPELRTQMIETSKNFLWSLVKEISCPGHRAMFPDDAPERWFIGNYDQLQTPLMLRVATSLGYEAWEDEKLVSLSSSKNRKSFYIKGVNDLSRFWSKVREESKKRCTAMKTAITQD